MNTGGFNKILKNVAKNMTDREVLILCKEWFQEIMERSDRLTSGNVSHGSKALRGVAKNYAEFVEEHLSKSDTES